MKKILVPFLIIIPLVLYLKLRNSSSEENNDVDSLEKDKTKSKTSGGRNNAESKAIKMAGQKTTVKKNTRCKATTARGKKCSRESLPESEFCWQHS
jgi:hypothetical protein